MGLWETYPIHCEQPGSDRQDHVSQVTQAPMNPYACRPIGAFSPEPWSGRQVHRSPEAPELLFLSRSAAATEALLLQPSPSPLCSKRAMGSNARRTPGAIDTCLMLQQAEQTDNTSTVSCHEFPHDNQHLHPELQSKTQPLWALSVPQKNIRTEHRSLSVRWAGDQVEALPIPRSNLLDSQTNAHPPFLATHGPCTTSHRSTLNLCTCLVVCPACGLKVDLETKPK